MTSTNSSPGITISGDHDQFERARTGLYSFDVLMGNKAKLGFPLRTLTELYANQGIGKTTFATFLAGVTAPPDSIIAFADLEGGLEREHLRSNLMQSGFTGQFKFAELTHTTGRKNGTQRSHGEMCQDVANSLMEGAHAAIFDSIGAYVSHSELANDIGEANMGRRAMEVAQLSRKLMSILRVSPDPAVAIMINHTYPNIGSRGYSTPGGNVKGYAAANRIMLYHKETFEDPHGTLVEMKLDKMRYGGKKPGQRALVFIIPGLGVSPHMTALFDCINLGLVSRSNTIKVGDKSYGYLKHIIQKVADQEDLEMFVDFYLLLEEYERTMYH